MVRLSLVERYCLFLVLSDSTGGPKLREAWKNEGSGRMLGVDKMDTEVNSQKGNFQNFNVKVYSKCKCQSCDVGNKLLHQLWKSILEHALQSTGMQWDFQRCLKRTHLGFVVAIVVTAQTLTRVTEKDLQACDLELMNVSWSCCFLILQQFKRPWRP